MKPNPQKRRTVRPVHPYVGSVLVYAYAAATLCIAASTALVFIRMRTPAISQKRLEPAEIVTSAPVAAETKPSCRSQCLANGFMPATHPESEIDGKVYCACDRTKIVFPSGGKPK